MEHKCHCRPSGHPLRHNRPSVDFVVNNRPMHTPQPVNSRKRPHSEPLSLHKTPRQLQKKQKVNHPSDSQRPAAFWDNLSKVWLTRNALRELDRRNNRAARSVLHHRQISQPVTHTALARWKEKNWQASQPAAKFLNCCSPQRLGDIQEFARLGGPDLSELRGYQQPICPLFPVMNPNQSEYWVQKQCLSTSRCSSTLRGSSTSRSTKPSKTTTIKSSGPYDRDFQQHLIDHGIYPHAYKYPDGELPPKPSNWNEIKERLARPRASLSPSTFTEAALEKFIRADAYAFKDKQVSEYVIPIIEGDVGDARCIAGGITFKNLDHLTDGTLVPGNPDHYHGTRPKQLDRQIRNELNGQVIPSTQHDLPIVPNFLLAAKGPDRSAAVAKRQASYDGALGARAMHSLQTYRQNELHFDHNAYTMSSIYHDGTLKMFTSHPSKPAGSNRPEYYLTQLNGWSMTANVDAFRQGATWYRNGRDWAKEQRDDAIRRANEQVTGNAIESTISNASFSTVYETSSDEESITLQTHFSFNDVLATETPDESLRSAAVPSEQHKRSRGKRRDAAGNTP